MSDLHILLVNPPQTVMRPDFGNTGTLYLPGDLIVRCINPGILSIASYLDAKCYKVEIIDMSEDSNFDALKNRLKAKTPWIVGISCSNGFSYLASLECAKIVKELCPQTLVVAGGQHIGPLGKIALLESPYLDIVVKYEGELVTEQIIEHYGRYGRNREYVGIPGIVYRYDGEIRENMDFPILLDLNEAPFLKFQLYPNFKKFNPYVEESRGCFFGCKYCTANYINDGKLRLKEHERFLAELKNTIALYGTEPTYPVLASTFGTNIQNTIKIAEGMVDKNIKWTTELRVDVAWHEYLDVMYASGFRIATIGLESASPEILLRMGKTKNPAGYIERAQQLINAASKYDDMLLKFNIIIYLGETPRTIKETLNFILRNSENLTVVRFSPVFGFPGVPFLYNFSQYETEFGSSFIKDGYWGKIHIYPVNVSKYFSFEEIATFCNTLEKIFADEDKYYEANKYTYGLEYTDNVRETVVTSRMFSQIENKEVCEY